MVFLVAQNGGFPGFDEVTLHFESVASEISRREALQAVGGDWQR